MILVFLSRGIAGKMSGILEMGLAFVKGKPGFDCK
jgi:hypothetical protein